MMITSSLFNMPRREARGLFRRIQRRAASALRASRRGLARRRLAADCRLFRCQIRRQLTAAMARLPFPSNIDTPILAQGLIVD